MESDTAPGTLLISRHLFLGCLEIFYLLHFAFRRAHLGPSCEEVSNAQPAMVQSVERLRGVEYLPRRGIRIQLTPGSARLSGLPVHGYTHR